MSFVDVHLKLEWGQRAGFIFWTWPHVIFLVKAHYWLWQNDMKYYPVSKLWFEMGGYGH